MRLAALFSGGKDSTYAVHLSEAMGHEVAYLLTMLPLRDDSWMYHTVNIGVAPMLAEAMSLESRAVETSGEKEEELEDLKEALKGLDIEGLITGSIASSYQRSRIDGICKQLGLTHVAPLWGRESYALLHEMLDRGMTIMVTAVAAMGLDESWLGRVLDPGAAEELKRLGDRFGVDVCGEGGEMETLVLDAPWFRSSLEIVGTRPEWDGTRGSYVIQEARLHPKEGDA